MFFPQHEFMIPYPELDSSLNTQNEEEITGPPSSSPAKDPNDTIVKGEIHVLMYNEKHQQD